ncbi:Iron-sulfur protein NUBPL [Manis javanica]|nr:Iron-sulfur protein NUBPL [Manis javanica]
MEPSPKYSAAPSSGSGVAGKMKGMAEEASRSLGPTWPSTWRWAIRRKACAGAARPVRRAAKTVEGVGNVSVNITFKVAAHAVQRGVQLLPGVKNIIAISSGKGGGARARPRPTWRRWPPRARVGILDADIYGPSQPMMMGISPPRKPRRQDHGAHGKPRRAGHVHRLPGQQRPGHDLARPHGHAGAGADAAPDQLEGSDYLLVDMPPGTGDIQLTLAQRVPMTGAVVVTTPQDIALIDAKKGVKMFEKVGAHPGLVENMAAHVCTNCGHVEHIFGAEAAADGAEYGIDYLAHCPLRCRSACRPTAASPP